METKRIEWIDMAKGIAMVMVILGHMPIPRYLSVFIYGCHMPLFFMLSGYILRDKGESVGKFCKRKMKSLLKPLLQYSIVLIIFHYFYYGLIVKSLSVTSVKNEIIGLFIQMKNGGKYSSSLWFLPCMFLAIIIVFLFIRKVKSLKMHIICTIIMGLVGSIVYCGSKIIGIHNNLPWCLDYVLLAATMIYIGYILNNYVRIKPFYTLVLGLFYITSCIWSYLEYEYITCLFGEAGNIGITWFQSIIGSIMFVGIAQSLNFRKTTILNYIGKNSLFFYAMQFVVFAAVNILAYNILKIDTNMGTISLLIFNFVYLAITLLLLYLLNEVKDKVLIRRLKKIRGSKDAK